MVWWRDTLGKLEEDKMMIRVFMDLWIDFIALLSEGVIETSGGGCPSLNPAMQYSCSMKC